jgi:prophage DNA circulation protein
MPAQDRLQETIVLTSPEGSEFEAKWVGNERSNQKKLGLFDYPGIAGTISQDLNVKSIQYPLTIYFDDEDYDLTANEFFLACGETGIWQVQHPVLGPLALQLTSYSQSMQPVTAGGSNVFELGFFEPADAEITQSESELKTDVSAQVEKTNASAIDSFNDKVKNASVASTTAIKQVTGKVTGIIDTVLSPIASLSSATNAAFNSIIRGIDETLDASVLQPLELAGQIINLVQLPGQVVLSTQEKLNTYKELATELFGVTTDDALAFEVKDMTLGAVNSAFSEIASDSDALTRSEILEQTLGVSGLFDDIIKNLEITLPVFNNVTIDKQYVAMQNTFSDYWITSAKAIRAMIKSSLGLAVEKRFVLTEYSHPLEIVWNEYNDDSKLDLFNETNNISYDEFFELKPGREVVIYQDVA